MVGNYAYPAPQNRRTMRRPKHVFHVRTRPWQIQPIMIAPVLPGETMKNLLLQTRAVTDPIKNSVIGWWKEYYFFYCKITDLSARDKLVEIMINPEADLSSLDSPTKLEHYHVNGVESPAINFVDLCLNRVVEEYFRFEGETVATASLGNLPAAHVAVDNILDSAANDAAVDAPADEDLTAVGSEFGALVKVSEVERALRRYQMMRMQGLVNMEYEDYLATFGVSVPEEKTHTPELIRYIREWQYPSNTIDPTNGTARSAVSWAISERADKDRHFKEPGFIFGVTVTRPKVYLRGLKSNAVQLMNNAYSWLPAVLRDDPQTSLRKVLGLDPPATLTTDAYWVDIRDLFMYGDQFINFALTATDANIIDLPTAALLKRYASAADADSLFVTPATLNFIREDGVVQLSIAGSVHDATPNQIGTNLQL